MKRTDPHLRELIGLSLIPNLGARRIRVLLKSVDLPQDVFRLSHRELTSHFGIGDRIAGAIRNFDEWDRVDRVLRNAERGDYHLMGLPDRRYPALLRQIFDPPVLLWIRGDPAVLSVPSIAVLGTRKPTSYGKAMAERFTRALVSAGLQVVSGLAYGIDAIAHRETLRAGGTTVAVLGSGIDRIYPSRHLRLADQIIDGGGAVVSEFPPGTAPDAGNFPVRNRTVSGMTLGTLVVESGVQGGSMITASAALDQNREVFVIPHALTDRKAADSGCNYLIQSGQGKLVQTIEDILSEVAVHIAEPQSGKNLSSAKRWESLDLDELAGAICKLLAESNLPRHIDELSTELDMPVHTLLPKLLELEMLECVRQSAGRKFELR